MLTDTMTLDEHGLLRVGRSWVALSDTEWRLVRVLMDHCGEVVPLDAVLRATWPDRTATARMLSVAMGRARARIAPLGVVITTVRGQGFVLDRRRADDGTPSSVDGGGADPT